MNRLVKKVPTVQIPIDLYERVCKYEGGKYTPRSVIATAVEEWLNDHEPKLTEVPAEKEASS